MKNRKVLCVRFPASAVSFKGNSCYEFGGQTYLKIQKKDGKTVLFVIHNIAFTWIALYNIWKKWGNYGETNF